MCLGKVKVVQCSCCREDLRHKREWQALSAVTAALAKCSELNSNKMVFNKTFIWRGLFWEVCKVILFMEIKDFRKYSLCVKR